MWRNMVNYMLANLDFFHVPLIAPVAEVARNREIMEIMSSFKFVSNYLQFFDMARSCSPRAFSSQFFRFCEGMCAFPERIKSHGHFGISFGRLGRDICSMLSKSAFQAAARLRGNQ
jgi:hypothetical protein